MDDVEASLVLVALVLLTELAELALFGAPGGGGGANEADVEEVDDDEDESYVVTRSLRIAASACERSTSSVLTVADDELVDEDEAEDEDDADDAEDEEDAEDVEEDDELESSAARRSLRSVSNSVRRLLALEELAVDESEDAPGGGPGGAPGGGPPAPSGPPEPEADADVDPSEVAPSCARNARTAADRLTALEASVDEVDVLADDALVALEFDWPAAPFWPAMLACSNRKTRLC